jgi:hypothetical protein
MLEYHIFPATKKIVEVMLLRQAGTPYDFTLPSVSPTTLSKLRAIYNATGMPTG